MQLRCNSLIGPEWGNQEGVARTARAEARGVDAADSRLAGPAMLLPQGGRRLQWEDWIPGPLAPGLGGCTLSVKTLICVACCACVLGVAAGG